MNRKFLPTAQNVAHMLLTCYLDHSQMYGQAPTSQSRPCRPKLILHLVLLLSGIHDFPQLLDLLVLARIILQLDLIKGLEVLATLRLGQDLQGF